MNMIRVFVSLLLLQSFVSLAWSTEYTKESTLTHVGRQGTRPVQPSTANREWISFPGGSVWAISGGSGGPVCAEGSAVLPEGDKSMLAIALAAIAAGATVVVNVDNSLPLIGAYCQVTAIYIVGA
jgi:hypothetical protein